MQIFPKITKIASSPTFLDRFSFCLFDLIGLGGGFKTSTQNFEINQLCKFKINQLCKFMQIYSKSQIKSQKMLLLIHFSTNFDLVCFIW